MPIQETVLRVLSGLFRLLLAEMQHFQSFLVSKDLGLSEEYRSGILQDAPRWSLSDVLTVTRWGMWLFPEESPCREVPGRDVIFPYVMSRGTSRHILSRAHTTV